MAKKNLKKYQNKSTVTHYGAKGSPAKPGLADGKLSKNVLDYTAREIAEGIYNTEKKLFNVDGVTDTMSKFGTGVYNEAKRKAGQAGDAFNATYNLLFKKRGGTTAITALDQVDRIEKAKLLKNKR